MKTRDEIPYELKWDFTHLFASSEEWEKAYNDAENTIPELEKIKGTLGRSAEDLYNAYETVYSVSRSTEKVGEYAFLKKTIDGGDAEAQAMCGRVTMLGVKLGAALAFFDPELASIPADTLRKWVDEYKPLSRYAHIIDDAVRQREHVLDEKSEAMLAKMGNLTGTPSDTYDMFTNVEMQLPTVKDEDGNDVQLTPAIYGVLRESGVKSVRDSAFDGMLGTYGRYINTLASLYSGSVKQDNFFAETRGYKSAREASLSGSNVDERVYDALVEALHAAVPSMDKYLKLRAEALGTDSLDVYDLYTPMVAEVEYPMPYETACDLVLKAVAPLGKEYCDVVARAYRENWIDVYETPGKESGAFSAGVYGVHPFVKLNYAGKLDDAFTLAHEMGHAMHSYLSSEKQDYANHDYQLLVAEVASTCNEVLLTKYLLSVETDKRRRAYILNHFLEGFRTTVFRQTLFAEFEHKAHMLEAEGTPATADVLNDVYEKLEKTYYPSAALRDSIKYEWAYIPHFYRAYYVYQYATGFCSAVAIASHILESGDASAYLEFLSSGGSDYPMNELKIAGIDLTSPSVVADAMKMFDETIDELKSLL